MGLPKQYEVTEAEMWLMYKNGEIYDYMTIDHIVLAKRKSDDSPVWVRVGN